ncbi:MAG: hypothetical protein EXS63_08455 [Candidatus Omnitrophica bacterium]|nr:hypothetical protein [Candidatus Omnitrophota bacterium]
MKWSVQLRKTAAGLLVLSQIGTLPLYANNPAPVYTEQGHLVSVVTLEQGQIQMEDNKRANSAFEEARTALSSQYEFPLSPTTTDPDANIYSAVSFEFQKNLQSDLQALLIQRIEYKDEQGRMIYREIRYVQQGKEKQVSLNDYESSLKADLKNFSLDGKMKFSSDHPALARYLDHQIAAESNPNPELQKRARGEKKIFDNALRAALPHVQRVYRYAGETLRTAKKNLKEDSLVEDMARYRKLVSKTSSGRMLKKTSTEIPQAVAVTAAQSPVPEEPSAENDFDLLNQKVASLLGAATLPEHVHPFLQWVFQRQGPGILSAYKTVREEIRAFRKKIQPGKGIIRSLKDGKPLDSIRKRTLAAEITRKQNPRFSVAVSNHSKHLSEVFPAPPIS